MKDGIQISSKGARIWAVTWSDNNDYLAMFSSWCFKKFLSKSVIGQHEKCSTKWVPCSGIKSDEFGG